MHRRLARVGHQFSIVTLYGDTVSLQTALREGRVSLVRDRSRQFLDGSYGDATYVRLQKAAIGSYEIEYIPHFEAERIAEEAGVTIEEIDSHPLPEDHHPIQEPIAMTMDHFNRLPYIESIGYRVPEDGFWARRNDTYDCIFITQRGQWMEKEIEFV